jgi:hypothetical protein
MEPSFSDFVWWLTEVGEIDDWMDGLIMDFEDYWYGDDVWDLPQYPPNTLPYGW